MKTIILTPPAHPHIKLKDIQTGLPTQNVPNALLLFDHVYTIAEFGEPGIIQIGNEHRDLCVHPLFRESSADGLAYFFTSHRENTLASALEQARHALQTGINGLEPSVPYMAAQYMQSIGEKNFVLSIETLNAVPTPRPDCTWAQLRAFRNEYRVERSSFWRAIEQIGTSVDLYSGHEMISKIRDKIADDILEYERVRSETWLSRTIERSTFTFSPAWAIVIAILLSTESITEDLAARGPEEIKLFLENSNWLGAIITIPKLVEIRLDLLHQRRYSGQGVQAMSYASMISNI